MKDAKGHGSNPHRGMDWNKEDFEDAALARASRIAHQTAVEDVGRLRGWTAAIKDQVRRFAKSTSGASPEHSPVTTAMTQFLRAPVTGAEHMADAGSHLYEMAGE